jgi:hypothetical protein
MKQKLSGRVSNFLTVHRSLHMSMTTYSTP